MAKSDASLFGIKDDFQPKRNLSTDVKLIHGDAFKVLAGMDDRSVDVIISDPPYSEQTHNGARTTVGGKRKGHSSFRDGGKAAKLITFESITPDQFVRFCKEAVRVTRRWVVTFCDWRYVHLLEEVGLIRMGVWIKTNAAPQMTGDRPAQGWEALAILHRPGKKKWNGGGCRAVWEYGHVDGKRHPTEKPLDLLMKLVELFSDEDETILDPFMGSGTTGLACVLTGRKFVGVEKDHTYFKLARRRIVYRR